MLQYFDMPAVKPLILFDIDRTLIDTNQLRILQRKTLAKALEISEDEIADAYLEYYGTMEETYGFRPRDFLGLLTRRCHLPIEKLNDIFFHPKNFQQVLYPEVLAVLTKLRQQNYTLGLYSMGETEFQEHKIIVNNLINFFDSKHRYISEDKTDKKMRKIIESLPENTIIIDDKPEIMAFLEHFPNIIPLHIVRNAKSHAGEYTLSSLNDLWPILDSLSNSGGSEK